MKLFLAIVDHGYEGGEPLGVFASTGKAWAALENDNSRENGLVYEITLDEPITRHTPRKDVHGEDFAVRRSASAAAGDGAIRTGLPTSAWVGLLYGANGAR